MQEKAAASVLTGTAAIGTPGMLTVTLSGTGPRD